MVEQFPAIEEVQDEVQLLWGLESIVEFDDEGATDLLQDLSFRFSVHILRGSHGRIFLQGFHRIQLIIIILAHQIHFAE